MSLGGESGCSANYAVPPRMARPAALAWPPLPLPACPPQPATTSERINAAAAALRLMFTALSLRRHDPDQV